MDDTIFMNTINTNEWEINTEGRYFNIVKTELVNDGIPETSISNVKLNAIKILNQCPNPLVPSMNQTTGIVIGKVQSGKTSNFISLLALAFDNGYNIVVVLGGTKKLLVEQNSERLSSYFNSSNNNDIIILNTSDHKEILCENELKKFLQNNIKIIIVVLKNKSNIEYINKNVFKDTIIAEDPVLIIDDEGDEASLNGLVNKRKKTTTYRLIESLKNNIERHAFISVTATPQANILINTCDILSPDFGVLIEPGKGYCGSETFHTLNSKYMVTIPNDEELLEGAGFPQSLIHALATFFVACGLQKYKENGMHKVSMLIHPSVEQIDHKKVKSKIDNLLENWQRMASNKRDISYSNLKKDLLLGYNEYINKNVILPPFEELEDSILFALGFCKTNIVNSKHNSGSTDKPYPYNIYIGGNMLGRGLTLKGLVITYIIRSAKGKSNVDTLQQRARWFGYRSQYIDLCRVFATEKIITLYQDIRMHELDLWETLNISLFEGKNFKDIARIFTLTDDLNMTRRNVASTKRLRFKNWYFQKIFETNEENIDNNLNYLKLIKNDFKNHIRKLNYGKKAQPHNAIFDLNFYDIEEKYLRKLKFPPNSAFNEKIISKFSILLKQKGIEAKLDLIWMRDGKPGIYKVNENGIVEEYMVGRRPKDTSVPESYKGDRYFLQDRDTIQLQIHQIMKKNTNIESPIFAMYIPDKYYNNLKDIVISEN